MRKREAEETAEKRRMEQLREKEREEEVRQIRQEAVHKALPIKHYKPVTIVPSGKTYALVKIKLVIHVFVSMVATSPLKLPSLL